MWRLKASSLFHLLLLNLAVAAASVESAAGFSRDDFPSSFVFGSGTSAYQVEGAAFEDGKTPSIWDTFAHAGNYKDNSTGDIACDEYHKYKEDVKLMVDTGLEAYRFSISWSRLIPNGRGPINPKGLQFYNNFINELISHGIQPHATLVHLDLPQVLEDEYGGWISPKIIRDFTAYADVCFREFGNRVSYWITVNEPNIFAMGGYDAGNSPPQRCSPPFGVKCNGGNSTWEPYAAAHNILLSHASVVRLYKSKYQANQHGFIGFSIYVFWLVPLTNATKDVIATQRAWEFFVGWLINPLVFGDYPEIVKKNAGSRIPSFTPLQSELVKGAYDFFGVNHYNKVYVKDRPNSLKTNQRDYIKDMAVGLILKWDDLPADEFPIDSRGLQITLEYFKQVYANPPMYVHENGQRTFRNASLNDTSRVKYLEGYIGSMLDAMRNGSDTRGYFTWSFLDVFELFGGYESSFGLYYVDRKDPDLKRYPKLSAHWYADFLKGRSRISSS